MMMGEGGVWRDYEKVNKLGREYEGKNLSLIYYGCISKVLYRHLHLSDKCCTPSAAEEFKCCCSHTSKKHLLSSLPPSHKVQSIILQLKVNQLFPPLFP